MTTAISLSVLDSSLYIPELRPKRKESALQEMVSRAHRVGAVRQPSLLLDTLSLRERLITTAIGKGVAVPYLRSVLVVEPRLVLARSRKGIDWGALDEVPVQIAVLVLSSAELSEEMHHDLIARAVAALRTQRGRQRVMAAESFDAVAAVFREVTA